MPDTASLPPIFATSTLDALAGRFAARAEAADRDARLPVESLADATEAGLQRITVPVSSGGHGAGIVTATSIARRLGRADPAPTLVMLMSWIQHAILADSEGWLASERRRLAEAACAGRGWANALRVEPALGTPARGGLPETVARRTVTGWRLSGRKIYCTGAGALHWFVVYARTDDRQPLVGNFLVPAHLDGISIEPTWDGLGLRASASHDVVFEDVTLPMEAAVDLRVPSAWGTMPARHAAWAFVPLAGLYLGIAEAARDWLLAFLHARAPSALGKPLATLERMQLAIGEIEASIHAAGTLLDAVASRADAGLLAPHEPSLTKLFVTERAIAVVEAAIRVTGNPGLARRNPLERHLRDVLCGRIHTPQSDSVLRAVGRDVLAAAAPVAGSRS